MKNFIKMTLASMLGTFLVLLLSGIMIVFTLFIMISVIDSDKDVKIANNTVLEIKLDYSVPERTQSEDLGRFSISALNFHKELGLNDIIANIRKAKVDSNIKGIYLDLNNFVAGGYGTVEEIRDVLIEFRKSGKFIIAYGDIVSQKAYYLASVADKVYVPQLGVIEFKGLSMEVPFFKRTLDKLEIEPQIFHYGKYKSAIEPFRFDKMSEAYKSQSGLLISSLFNHIIGSISRSRNIQTDSLSHIANELLVHSPADAVKYRIVDGVWYKDQVMDDIKKRLGLKKNDKINTVSMGKYNDVKSKSGKYSRDKIAVIYAEGDIVSGSGDENNIGTENISKAFRRARTDDKIKAVVFRINSPGGSALTSDLIWREVVLTNKVKPVVVSMGTVAASGGYYIAAGAGYIVANPNTITGSIGVFGIIPNMEKFFRNKLGITFDRVKTGKYSDFGTVNRPFSPQEKLIVQNEIDNIYRTFVSKVSVGRKQSFEKIHNIAQGMVWTGLQAKENGLVDEIGGLDDALRIASDKAKLKSYSIVELPELEEFWESLFDDISLEAKNSYMKYTLKDNFTYFMQLKYITEHQGVQARIPFDPNLD